jgi:hypothetical protein
MTVNTMLPILLLTALKDQFLVHPDVARYSTANDKKIPHLPYPLTLALTHKTQSSTL